MYPAAVIPQVPPLKQGFESHGPGQGENVLVN